jgi:hypothetical protein
LHGDIIGRQRLGTRGRITHKLNLSRVRHGHPMTCGTSCIPGDQPAHVMNVVRRRRCVLPAALSLQASTSTHGGRER